MAEELFAIPREDEDAEEPNIVWAHKTRGYPQGDQESIEAELSDMEYFPVGKMTDYKNEVRHFPVASLHAFTFLLYIFPSSHFFFPFLD